MISKSESSNSERYGAGTTFTVFFPALARTVTGTPAQTAHPQLKGIGTILVIDDEEIVRSAAKNALAYYGYSVLLAENGKAAVELFQQHANEISLVLLDLTIAQSQEDVARAEGGEQLAYLEGLQA